MGTKTLLLLTSSFAMCAYGADFALFGDSQCTQQVATGTSGQCLTEGGVSFLATCAGTSAAVNYYSTPGCSGTPAATSNDGPSICVGMGGPYTIEIFCNGVSSSSNSSNSTMSSSGTTIVEATTIIQNFTGAPTDSSIPAESTTSSGSGSASPLVSSSKSSDSAVFGRPYVLPILSILTTAAFAAQSKCVETSLTRLYIYIGNGHSKALQKCTTDAQNCHQ